MKSFATIILLLLFLTGLTNACSQNRGPAGEFENVSTKIIHSRILNEDRRIFIYTPENSNGEQLPVLYLLDGEVDKIFEEALIASKTNPHIIIGIETIKNRNRDMIPAKSITGRPSGGANKFLQFIVEELQPFVNNSYNSNGKSILYGGSNAGLFTIYAMLENPDAFFAYISSSTTIGHCSEFMIKKARELHIKDSLKDKVLFIHYGLRDSNERVTQHLPAYCELLREEFNDYLSMEVVALPNAGHVPEGGILEGIKFIYNDK